MRILSAPSTSLDVLGATFDAMPHEVIVIDQTGVIVMVNEPYVTFAADNGLEGTDTLGTNYLTVCQTAAHEGNRTAGRVAAALQAILAGERTRFDTVYDCHSPWENRWFRLSITRWDQGEQHGAILVHQDATADIQAERAVLLAQRSLEALDDTQYAIELQARLDALVRRVEFISRHPMTVHGTSGAWVITAPEPFMTAFARLLLLSPRGAAPVEVKVTPAGRSVLLTIHGLRKADEVAMQALAALPGRCELGMHLADGIEVVDIVLKAGRRPSAPKPKT